MKDPDSRFPGNIVIDNKLCIEKVEENQDFKMIGDNQGS